MPTFTPPPNFDPTLVHQSSVRLFYPYISPTTDFTLSRGPDLGNTEVINFTRIYTQSRSGTPILFWDEMWPTEDKLTLTFSWLPKSDVDLLQSFLFTTIGKEIGLRDHENQQWKGFILNPNTDFIDQAKKDECHNTLWTVELNFQGVLQSWP